VAVCVVERRCGGATPQLLLVRRPPTGLLAGLWEFPSVLVPADATPVQRRRAMDGFLAQRLGLTRPFVPAGAAHEQEKRSHVGDVVHVFSHIR
jgi:A/G-specific adenine glycosylase